MGWDFCRSFNFFYSLLNLGCKLLRKKVSSYEPMRKKIDNVEVLFPRPSVGDGTKVEKGECEEG